MRGAIERVDMDPEEYRLELARKHTPLIGQLAGVNRHVANQAAQKGLRDTIAWWAGHQRAQNRSDSESYRRFYFRYGVDVWTAKTLKAVDADELAGRINQHLGELNRG